MAKKKSGKGTGKKSGKGGRPAKRPAIKAKKPAAAPKPTKRVPLRRRITGARPARHHGSLKASTLGASIYERDLDKNAANHATLRERALSDRRKEVLTDFPTAMAAGTVTNTWRSSATRIYRNWLSYLCARKPARVATA